MGQPIPGGARRRPIWRKPLPMLATEAPAILSFVPRQNSTDFGPMQASVGGRATSLLRSTNGSPKDWIPPTSPKLGISSPLFGDAVPEFGQNRTIVLHGWFTEGFETN